MLLLLLLLLMTAGTFWRFPLRYSHSQSAGACSGGRNCRRSGVRSVLWAQAPTTFWIKMPSKSTTIHICAQAEYDQIRGWNVKEHLVAEVQVMSKLWAPTMSLLSPQSLKFVEWLTKNFDKKVQATHQQVSWSRCKQWPSSRCHQHFVTLWLWVPPCSSECHLAPLSATLQLWFPPCCSECHLAALSATLQLWVLPCSSECNLAALSATLLLWVLPCSSECYLAALSAT